MEQVKLLAILGTKNAKALKGKSRMLLCPQGLNASLSQVYSEAVWSGCPKNSITGPIHTPGRRYTILGESSVY